MASKATKRSHSKIPFTKFMLWLSTFRCVYLCHFWIARGWLFVDPSMDSGILKHSNRSQNARQRPFFLRPQSVCLVGHTDSGGWILVNMASYYTWIRYFFIISAWSGTKIPIHLRKQQSPRPPLEKPCTLWESLYKSIHFFGGDITHNLLEKSNFQNHHHSLPPWLPQLGLEVWDLIFCQKTANCVCGMRGPTKSSKTSYPNSSRCWVQVTCFKKYESTWIKSDHIPVFQIIICLKPHSRHHFRIWFVWVWSLSFWNTPDTVQWEPLCHATIYQLVHKAPF